MNGKLTKIDFTGKEIIVGLDVHQKNWHATIIVEDAIIQKSLAANSKKLSEYLKENFNGGKFKVGYEAGCFGFWIKEELEKEGIPTIVINPADIPTSDKDKRTKTDKIDSKKIALSIKGGMIRPIYAPIREHQELRSLARHRYDLTKKTTRVKNQIKGLLKYYGIKYPQEYESPNQHWSKKFIKWLSSLEFETIYLKNLMASYLRELAFLKEEMVVILGQLKELIKNEHFAVKYKILRSIPGVGFVTAITVLTEIIDINRFITRDEFISFLGLSPGEHSSGESRKVGHLNSRCNHPLRSVIIESSWIAVRKDPAMAVYFNEVSKKIGKTKAIIKVAKKLAARMRYILFHEVEYVIGVAA